MKFHGSYQQDNRDLRAPGQQKKFQFMLRLKMPGGDFPASLYQVLDDLSVEHGNMTIRATTRCAWQVHGIRKGDLKPVFSKIMNAGGSCIGACGDLSRNVMCTPAPFTSKPYAHARFVSRMLGELLAPQTGAFSEIWLDGEKAATLEYWKHDLDMDQVRKVMRHDSGNGIVFPDHEEPLYGETYLPRKFKMAVTVPGDNSIDIYTQDIGIVCIPDADGNTIGYNLIVGGGMGRTHKKESTFARTGDHLGYVAADKLWEAVKAIVATQRDHGNRTVRANARMKYLVDKLGIDAFRSLVETYFGEHFEPYRETLPWKYKDWLGWHEQGDGNLFLGLFVENGRVKDEGDFRLKTALRRIADAYEFDMIVSPNQNVLLKNIAPSQKEGIEAILKDHGVRLATEYNENLRLSMACPAMPLCGLAVTEAERHMPSIVARMNALFKKRGVTVPITMRMTGCPNGCARPYMAEIGFVGSGPKTYQLWLGGCPNQTRIAWPYLEKVRDEDLESTLGPVLAMFVQKSRDGEAFGDFCSRMGKSEIDYFVEHYEITPSAVNGAPSTLTYEAPVAVVPNKRVTIARGAARVTIVGSPSAAASVIAPVKKGPVPVTAPFVSDPVAESTSGSATSEEVKSATPPAETAAESQNGVPKKSSSRPRPRLTVSNEIMERLKNIAALRDVSCSHLADSILSEFLKSFPDDEDLMDLGGEI